MKTCPSCKQAFDPRDSGTSPPFCSDRCRLIDLGAWLNEERRIPSEPAESLPDSPSDPATQH